MGMKVSREQGVMISVSWLGSIVVALATAYPVAQDVLAGEIQEQIQKELKPTSDALEVMTSSAIRNLRNTISALNFKRTMCEGAPGCWTLIDQQNLDNAQNDLAAAESALRGLRSNK